MSQAFCHRTSVDGFSVLSIHLDHEMLPSTSTDYVLELRMACTDFTISGIDVWMAASCIQKCADRNGVNFDLPVIQ